MWEDSLLKTTLQSPTKGQIQITLLNSYQVEESYVKTSQRLAQKK